LQSSKAHVAASTSTRVAFRTIKLIQEPLIDQEGTSFLFEVNGIRIFCGGSNWIPADSFLTEVSDERYRAWIKLMAGLLPFLTRSAQIY
jgi:beta-mannosidase